MVWRGAWLVLLASAHAAPTYVGALACAKCHAETHRKWSQSRHSKMVQPATQSAVKGDFARGEVKLRGDRYRLRESDGAY